MSKRTVFQIYGSLGARGFQFSVSAEKNKTASIRV